MAQNTDAKEATEEVMIEASFNDAELEDIMSEIESLEKDFHDDDEDTSTASSAEDAPNVELASEAEEPVHAAEVETDNVVPMVTAVKNVSTNTLGDALGKVCLQMSFDIAGETAKVQVNDVSGITFEYKGSTICINGSEGCVVEMQGGAKLVIPLNTVQVANKKAS